MTTRQTRLLKSFTFTLWIVISLALYALYNVTLQSNKLPAAWFNVTGEINRVSQLTSGQRNQEDVMQKYQEELPNVPFEFWTRIKNSRFNATCAHAPELSNLRFHNDYWQVFHNRNVSYHIFNAYYDTREHITQPSSVVRILVMMNQPIEPKNPIHCQLWYDDKNTTVLAPVMEHRLIWIREWGTSGHFYPYLLTCVVPLQLREGPAPQAVSLVVDECATATNLVRIYNERPSGNATKQRFAVCVKGLDYPYADLGPRLVEWLEMQRLLGASKVITYRLSVHPNLEQVLQHYIEEGFLEVHPLSLGSEMVTKPLYLHEYLRASVPNKRLNEIVPYNDCFYRNMYKYSYIVTIDIDEVIMPLGNITTWTQLINETSRVRSEGCKYGYGSLCVRNVHFPINGLNYTETPKAPRHMFMLQHVHRDVPEAPGLGAKCFQNTSDVLMLHNHYNLDTLKTCRWHNLPPDVAYLQHYRLLRKPEEWKTQILDESIYRYKDALIATVEPVLKKLGYLN
ncbi:uncharacterized protein LOC101456259 [Ceratitis capitata]|uniref:uncharacterized protein LOC101456259 n=1 Tax=Ceratitis capitata TaxID=7213 RepID=UPI0006188605|nr:uncharacterized protein LOC101456259 [Ceratitis capitata]